MGAPQEHDANSDLQFIPKESGNSMTTAIWQHPYVNVFKHCNIQTWKKSSKEGDVSSIMDKTLKCSVYRITGSIPAGNYIQLPRTSTQSLGLTGRYMYLLFKPIPSKFFVIHLDLVTHDGLIVRLSFSNLFKEFKSTSTWLQFPYICHADYRSVCGQARVNSKDDGGPAPVSTRWTVLCMDLQYLLSMYLNRRYSYIKSAKLCANMMVKNIFTSDTLYEPGITFDDIKRSGVTPSCVAPMPREMAFHLPKDRQWDEFYDHIKFPSEASKKPFDSIQYSTAPLSKGPPGVVTPKRIAVKTVHSAKQTANKQTHIDTITTYKKPIARPHKVIRELPSVGVDKDINIQQTTNGEIHVYAHPNESITVHQGPEHTEKIYTNGLKSKGSITIPAVKEPTYQSLEPDPILNLRRIVGFGGATVRDLLWSNGAAELVYPCYAVVVAMHASNGHQRFFIGHTEKVSCISMNSSCTMLASGQTGSQSVVRVWKYRSAECVCIMKTHAHSLHCLSFSKTGSVLCGVGKDSHNKNMVVVWNTERCMRGGEVQLLAKAHTDVDIQRLNVAHFDDTRMVSCGRDNIRLWRVKNGQLRSAPVNLGEHHCMEFSDCCFEAGYEPTKEITDRLVYACSKSGHIFEINYQKVCIQHVRRLLPAKDNRKDKQTFNSGSGISINSMCVNEAFCVTGSDDGYLRLWPLDFKHVYLEAEHDGPVTAVDISSDGMKILAGTCTGNIGVLDVSSRAYTTLMRSHVSRILSASLDPLRRHLATVSEDKTIRIWDLDTLQQLYDFSAPTECPCTVAFHPTHHMFSCGFDSGNVRVFNIESTSMLAEHKQHRGRTTGLLYAPSGTYMYSCDSLGSLALYDSADSGYRVIRVLANTVHHGEHHAPCALTISPDGLRMAFVGPTQYTVSVVDGKSLDEVLRIDITSLNPSDNSRTIIDSAIHVQYAPRNVRHLLVTTSANKLLKFDARSGKILAEIDGVQRSNCTALDVSVDGRYLATAGDRVIKIWDYSMRLDINFQVFIGHSEAINRVMFTPDSLSVLSIGEAIFVWDFLAHVKQRPQLEGRTSVKSYITGKDEEFAPYQSPSRSHVTNGNSPSAYPRRAIIPQSYPPDENMSDISSIPNAHVNNLQGVEINSQNSDDEFIETAAKHNQIQEDNLKQTLLDLERDDPHIPPSPQILTVNSPLRHSTHNTPTKLLHTPLRGSPPRHTTPLSSPPRPHHNGSVHQDDVVEESCSKPACYKHFVQRPKVHSLSQRRYTAPPNQAGLNLHSVIGYNGNGRDNMIWHPDTGLFVYSTGCLLVVEDLNKGTQRHLMGHVEEISTITLQHDCQVLASASGAFGMTPSQICIWDMKTFVCKKVLSQHEYDIVKLAYSRDDRFLISVGDYRDRTIIVWCTDSLVVLTSTTTTHAVNDLLWDPFTVNEFASVGHHGSILFWLLDETGSDVSLNFHEADVPSDVRQQHHVGSTPCEFTTLEYGGDSTLYISDINGQISAWDTRQNTCFLHWTADSQDIGVVVGKQGRLITGGAGGAVRLWGVCNVGELKQSDTQAFGSEGLTMEDEMNVDGSIVSAAFDDTLDMGIVGTSAGTLWYINWTDRTSTRLVSGHHSKVNDIVLSDSEFLATCSDDGSVRVWSLLNREQTLQFQVREQSCNCLSFSPWKPESAVENSDGVALPNIVAGYSDGTVRMFDLNKVEMVLKMQPHASDVTAIGFSADGRMILSGDKAGLIAISSPTTGMTVRVINDHQGAPICNIHAALAQDVGSGICAPLLWLASSADRRVSVWSADWTKDFCELIDWLTFAAPAFTPDGNVVAKNDLSYYKQVPPSLARFSASEPDVIVYTGYGMQKLIQFYSITQKKVIRTVPLTHWATCLDMCPTTALLAVGIKERLIKMMDYYEGSFQDFVAHNDEIDCVKFSPDGRWMLTSSHSEICIWDVTL